MEHVQAKGMDGQVEQVISNDELWNEKKKISLFDIRNSIGYSILNINSVL
jgi:hypothetical protein